MSGVLTARCHRLAGSLAELKEKVHSVLATELSQAVGTTVRDVLVAALVDQYVTPIRAATTRSPASRPTTGRWADEDDRARDEWGDVRDPWDDPDDEDRHRSHARYACDDRAEVEPGTAVPAAAALAVGRWWLAKNGSTGVAVGLGVLAAGLGLAGGPVARVALAVLASVADLLAAEAALSRSR